MQLGKRSRYVIWLLLVFFGYVLIYYIWSRIQFANMTGEMGRGFYYLPVGSPNALEYSIQTLFLPLNELDQKVNGVPYPAGLLDYGGLSE
jgi:hypothetical protein